MNYKKLNEKCTGSIAYYAILVIAFLEITFKCTKEFLEFNCGVTESTKMAPEFERHN